MVYRIIAIITMNKHYLSDFQILTCYNLYDPLIWSFNVLRHHLPVIFFIHSYNTTYGMCKYNNRSVIAFLCSEFK